MKYILPFITLSLMIHLAGAVAVVNLDSPKEKEEPIEISINEPKVNPSVASDEESQKETLKRIEDLLKKAEENRGELGGKGQVFGDEKSVDEVASKFKSFEEEGTGICPPDKIYKGFGASFVVKGEIVHPKTGEIIPMLEYHMVDNTKYIVIDLIKKNGPLDRIGLKSGDWIEEFIQSVTKKPVGTKLTFTVIRNNVKHTYSAVSEEICVQTN